MSGSEEKVPQGPVRRVPRTDVVLEDARLSDPIALLGRRLVKQVVRSVQQSVREEKVSPGEVVEVVLSRLPPSAASFRKVINATGVLLHTNLGRAPLSSAAIEAVARAAGTVDVELDLRTGKRCTRGLGVLEALKDVVTSAEEVLVVNNGAAALVLCAAASSGREVVVSRGELIEIGDGFRVPELLESCGVVLREVGTTNRTVLHDYENAIGANTAFVLKVHTSNYIVKGFTASVSVSELATLPVPVIVDIGSGLLRPEPELPDEPDAERMLAVGATAVTASGDKLLGGPQAGIIFGRREFVSRLRRHPMARALRVDKMTLAALEASILGPRVPVVEALKTPAASVRERAEKVAAAVNTHGIVAKTVRTEAMVGGGAAPGVLLESWAVSLPEVYAAELRQGRKAVMGYVCDNLCYLDLRSVDPSDDSELVLAIQAVLER